MAGTVTLLSHDKVGSVRAIKMRVVGALADGTVTPFTLRSLGEQCGDAHGKLLAIQTNPAAAATTVTLANPSAASDDIIDTSGAHTFTAGTPVRFKTITGGSGLNTTTVYYVIAANLGSTTLQISATLGGAAVNFTTDITAGTLTSDMTDAPTSNYDITLLDEDGFDLLNSVGLDRHTTNTERALVTGAPYFRQGSDLTLTIANQSVKYGAVDITLIYTPFFL